MHIGQTADNNDVYVLPRILCSFGRVPAAGPPGEYLSYLVSALKLDTRHTPLRAPAWPKEYHGRIMSLPQQGAYLWIDGLDVATHEAHLQRAWNRYIFACRKTVAGNSLENIPPVQSDIFSFT